MADPVILYKGGDQKTIASVDVAGWLADGWATSLDAITAESTAEAVIELPSPEESPQSDAVTTEAEASIDAEEKTSVKRK